MTGLTGRWTFVRHAESTGNVARRLTGHQDVALTEDGHAQARALGAALRGVHFDRVLASDLQRVRQTAAPVLDGRDVPVVWLPELRERHFGDWEGRPIDELRRSLDGPDWQEVVLSWTGRSAGGESWADLARRTTRVLAELDAPGHTLVVAHGGVIRVLLGLIDGTPRSRIPGRRVENVERNERALPLGSWAALLAQL